MDPRMLITAIPWLRRAWKLLPGPLRMPVLVLAAVAGIYYAVTGREELKNAIREMRDGGDDGATIDQRGHAA